MENTSADPLAQELLEHCLAGTPFPEHLLDGLLQGDRSRALFLMRRLYAVADTAA